MTNFLTHLRDAVIEKKLFPNKSKTGNWLSLLNHQQLEEGEICTNHPKVRQVIRKRVRLAI